MSSSPTKTALPDDLWLLILLQLSPTDLLALKLSSRPFHALLTALAPQTVNHLILTHYPTEAAILQTVHDPHSDWLIPTHPCIADEEARAALSWQKRQNKSSSRSGSGSGSGSGFPRDSSPFSTSFSYSGSNNSFTTATPNTSLSSFASNNSSNSTTSPKNPIITKLSTGGPHYLQFLREYSLEIRIYHSLFLSGDENLHTNNHQHHQASSNQQQTQRHTSRTAAEILSAQNRARPQPDVFREKVGLYCVRRFLNRLDRVGGGVGNGLVLGENEEMMLRGMREGLAWFYV